MARPAPAVEYLRRGELRTIRRITALAAVVIIAAWFAHRAISPGAVDPLWARIVLAAWSGTILALTYLRPRRSVFRVMDWMYYAFALWAIGLIWSNGLDPNYAVGGVVVLVAASLGFMDDRTLRRYLAVIFTLVGAMVIALPPATGAGINGPLFFGYIVLFCLLAFWMLRDRLLLSQKLAASRLRYALAADGANDGLWDWEVLEDRLYLSNRWFGMLGLSVPAEGAGIARWLARIHPDDRPMVEAELKRHRDGSPGHFQTAFRILHADGGWRWFDARGVAVKNSAGKVARMAGSQTDITARKRAEAQLLHDAFHDALTGLPNRALLSDRLTQVITHTLRQPDEEFALLYLDLDRFKVVNDSLGHAAGDELLQAMARRLSALLRQGDTVARLGGDEFAIVLPNLDPAGITGVVERVQAAIAEPVRVGPRELGTTASIGIVLGPGPYMEASEVLRDADIAMYRAKALGPGRHAIFDQVVQEHALSRLELEADLRGAVERGELVLHYQPIMSLISGRLVGFEALARWDHPERGFLPPAAFIPLSEETGLIVPIGKWILEDAAMQALRWPGGLTINVNVSGRQLSHPDFVDHVRGALELSGLEPGRLQLEITESVLLRDPEAAIEVLNALRGLGVQLYLDDFGTGYSSFSYLHRFPIDAVKIDRSFVHRMDEDPRNAAIVRALVVMAQSLGMFVVAEGVERQEEVQHLRAAECAFGQGYLFSRPVDAETAAALLPGAATVSRA